MLGQVDGEDLEILLHGGNPEVTQGSHALIIPAEKFSNAINPFYSHAIGERLTRSCGIGFKTDQPCVEIHLLSRPLNLILTILTPVIRLPHAPVKHFHVAVFDRRSKLGNSIWY